MALVRRRVEPSEPPPPLSAPNRPTTLSPTLSCSGLLPFLRFDRLALTFFAAGRPVGGVRCASAAAGETAASAGAPSSSPLSDDASDDDRARRGMVVQRSDTSRHKTKNNVLPHQPMEHAGPAVAQARTRRSQQYPTRTTHGLTDGLTDATATQPEQVVAVTDRVRWGFNILLFCKRTNRSVWRHLQRQRVGSPRTLVAADTAVGPSSII
jgi:hypothetical protein